MKKNLPLIAGILIPIAMIVFVAASIYVPGLFIKPQYNFLYATGEYYGNSYFVNNNQLQQNISTTTTPYPPNRTQGSPELFVYNIATNKSEEISFSDAQKFALDQNTESPDGFSVVTGTSGGSFPFFDGPDYDYGTEYLSGHNISKKLNIQNGDESYENFTFLGWIND